MGWPRYRKWFLCPWSVGLEVLPACTGPLQVALRKLVTVRCSGVGGWRVLGFVISTCVATEALILVQAGMSQNIRYTGKTRERPILQCGCTVTCMAEYFYSSVDPPVVGTITITVRVLQDHRTTGWLVSSLPGDTLSTVHCFLVCVCGH